MQADDLLLFGLAFSVLRTDPGGVYRRHARYRRHAGSFLCLFVVTFSRAQLPDPPVDGMIGQGKRTSNPRLESITDLAFADGRVLVAGLSNEEFSSTLRAIPFPFQNAVAGTKGLAFEKVDWTGIDQLDRFDNRFAVVVRRASKDVLNLESLPLP